MRRLLALVLWCGCDRAAPPATPVAAPIEPVTSPVASPVAEVEVPAAPAPTVEIATPATDAKPPVVTPPSRAKVERQDGSVLDVPHDAALFGLADGRGTRIAVDRVGDPAAVSAALPGSTVVEGFRRTAIAIDDRIAVEIVRDRDAVAIALLDDAVATAEGATVGMGFAELQAAVPATTCVLEGGEDGWFVQCELPRGWTATFAAKAPKGEPGEGMDALGELVGRATIGSIGWRAQGVPLAAATSSRETGVLPAGVHWHPWQYSPCEHASAPVRCLVPRAAVVARIDATPEETTKALATIEARALAAGYPLVVHTDELVLAEAPRQPGIAIVLGLFASIDAAQAWQRTAAPEARVVALSEATTLEQQPQHVVARARPTDAPRAKGACTIPAGAIAVLSREQQLDDPYGAIPFPCEGGGTASLPLEDTWVGALVGERTTGGVALWQLVGAECDAPRFKRWDADERGRPRGAGRLLPTRGCSG